LLDRYHRIDDLRRDPVEPNPQEPIERRKLRPAGPLSPQHGQMMTHGDQLNCDARPRKRNAKSETTAERIATMTATVRLAGENRQPFAALWRFE
jgi:hypothetical protein